MVHTPDYRRSLPHFTPNDSPYYVTTRLTDSLPVSVLKKLQADHLDLMSLQEKEPDIDLEVLRRLRKRYLVELDKALDACLCGPKWLAQQSISNLVKDNLFRLEREGRLQLWSFSIMPNHIHILFSLNAGNLADVMHLLKGRSAFEANRILHRKGSFWQHESYDHVARENEFGRIVQYILLNPVVAKLVGKWQDWPGTYLHPSIYGFENIGLK